MHNLHPVTRSIRHTQTEAHAAKCLALCVKVLPVSEWRRLERHDNRGQHVTLGWPFYLQRVLQAKPGGLWGRRWCRISAMPWLECGEILQENVLASLYAYGSVCGWQASWPQLNLRWFRTKELFVQDSMGKFSEDLHFKIKLDIEKSIYSDISMKNQE